jgi:shikimate kinase
MASGKSTVGPLLADALGTRFVDLDWLVEARTGRTVAELFEAGGERAFRVAEAGALAETTRGAGAVIATGGGTLVAPANLRAAKAAGVVVWLRASTDVLVRRLSATDLAHRPLLAGPDGHPLVGDALRDRVRSLIGAREPHYARADVIVEADGPPAAVARDVAEALRGWERVGSP